MNSVSLRIFVYDWIVAHGAPPSLAEIGAEMGVEAADARRAVGALNIGKTVLPHPQTGEIWMAGPFAAAPTPYHVRGSRASWYANCAWDMLGVAAIVGEPVQIDAACTDCGEPMQFHADSGGVRGAGLVHILVPARDWYKDVGFT